MLRVMGVIDCSNRHASVGVSEIGWRGANAPRGQTVPGGRCAFRDAGERLQGGHSDSKHIAHRSNELRCTRLTHSLRRWTAFLPGKRNWTRRLVRNSRWRRLKVWWKCWARCPDFASLPYRTACAAVLARRRSMVGQFRPAGDLHLEPDRKRCRSSRQTGLQVLMVVRGSARAVGFGWAACSIPAC